jgi:hypothetical protein
MLTQCFFKKRFVTKILRSDLQYIFLFIQREMEEIHLIVKKGKARRAREEKKEEKESEAEFQR